MILRRSLRAEAAALVVDDDNDVRCTVRELLKTVGYHSVEAVDGTDAVARHSPGVFDVVVLDLQMPRQSGLEALSAIRSVERGVGVVLVSGDPPPGLQDLIERDGRLAFLRKPFGMRDLLRAVESVASLPCTRLAL
jgi:CheY-like chemotaxis protein